MFNKSTPLYLTQQKCAICGKVCPITFTKKRKFCSEKCSDKDFRLRHRDYIHAYWKIYYQNNKFKLRKNAWRFEILMRDNFTCQYCGRKAPDVILEVDHVRSQYDGGSNTSENYITSCLQCNKGKHKKSVELISLPHSKTHTHF
jgi:5-methylcytosine-specific restriction endonuclease McrA